MDCNSTNSTGYHDGVSSFQLTLTVLHFIFLFLGLLGNIAVIFYNIFLNRDKTPSSCLIINLAFADLLVCLTFYPVKIFNFFEDEKHEKELLCPLRLTTLYVSLFLSVMILLSITVDKYLYIAKPLKYPLIVTTRRIFILLGCIWLAAMVQLPLVFLKGIKKNVQHKFKKCHYQLTVIWLNFIVQLVPTCIITILNYKMFKIVKHQRLRIASDAIVLQPLQPKRVQSKLQSKQVELEQIKSKQIEFKETHFQQVESDQGETGQLQSKQVETEQLQSKQVETEQLQSKQEETEQLQSKQVETEQLQSELLDLEKMQSDQGKTEQIQPDQEETEQIQCNRIESRQIRLEQSEQEALEEIQSEERKPEKVQSEQSQAGTEQSNTRMVLLRHLLVEMKAVKTFAIIVVVLTCSVVPYNMLHIMRVYSKDVSCRKHSARLITHELLGVNSIANAFIYALRHKKYIQAYRRFFSAAWTRITSLVGR